MLRYFDIARYLRQKRNSQRMDAYLGKALDERYGELCAVAAASANAPADPRKDCDVITSRGRR
jgi:alkylhydroperoxidase/carboxymuconolactone decarboxylase family protein YurZ